MFNLALNPIAWILYIMVAHLEWIRSFDLLKAVVISSLKFDIIISQKAWLSSHVRQIFWSTIEVPCRTVLLPVVYGMVKYGRAKDNTYALCIAMSFGRSYLNKTNLFNRRHTIIVLVNYSRCCYIYPRSTNDQKYMHCPRAKRKV